jgi:hypothetical protein
MTKIKASGCAAFIATHQLRRVNMKMSSAILGALFALFVLAGSGLSSTAHAGTAATDWYAP